MHWSVGNKMVLEQVTSLINLNEYTKAIVLFFALFFILRVGLYFFEKLMIKITTRTKTDLDELLLKKSSKPLTIVALLISLIFALEQLTLRSNLDIVIQRSVYSFMAIAISYLIFVILDVALIRVWKRLAAKTESDVDDTIGRFVHEILKIALIVILFILLLNIWGIDVVPLLGALGIAGLAVALALQPTLSNIFSGISIILDGTFKVGDIVKIESGEMGEIFSIGLRTTRIKSFDNEMVIVPNSKLANSNVQNFQQPDVSIRINFDFNVEYGVDPEYIKKITIEEIKQIEIRKKDEEIRVLFTEMADNALIFKVMFWVDHIDKKWPAHQEAISRIYRRLYQEKIGIPFPQRTIWMRDEGKAKSPNPLDEKFKKVRGKYYSAFGHEYKEKQKEKVEEEKRKSILERLRWKKEK